MLSNVTHKYKVVVFSKGKRFRKTKIKVKVLVTQLCLTLCDPMDCSLPGSSVHGILQARILGWPFPSPGDFSDPGIKPVSPALQAYSLPSEQPGKSV